MAYDEFDFNQAMNRVIKVLVIWMVILFVLALLASCKSVEYVPVIQAHTDTMYITKWKKDSVWLHDSVHVKEKGDTVLVEKWHTKYVESIKHDTTYVATHDTVPKPYTVEVIKEVPAELSWWQRLRLWIGNIGLLALLGVVGYWGVRMWKVYHSF